MMKPLMLIFSNFLILKWIKKFYARSFFQQLINDRKDPAHHEERAEISYRQYKTDNQNEPKPGNINNGSQNTVDLIEHKENSPNRNAHRAEDQ